MGMNFFNSFPASSPAVRTVSPSTGVSYINLNRLSRRLLFRQRCLVFESLIRSARDETGTVIDFLVYSIIVIIGSLWKLAQLKTFLMSHSAYRGLSIYTAPSQA